MKANRVTVIPYDREWKCDFERIKNDIERVIGHLIIGIELVGCTSVEGMAAKPCFDFDVIIKDYSVFDDLVRALSSIG